MIKIKDLLFWLGNLILVLSNNKFNQNAGIALVFFAVALTLLVVALVVAMSVLAFIALDI